MPMPMLPLALALLLLGGVKGDSCFAATFETAQSNFEYKAELRDTECDLSNTM